MKLTGFSSQESSVKIQNNGYVEPWAHIIVIIDFNPHVP